MKNNKKKSFRKEEIRNYEKKCYNDINGNFDFCSNVSYAFSSSEYGIEDFGEINENEFFENVEILQTIDGILIRRTEKEIDELTLQIKYYDEFGQVIAIIEKEINSGFTPNKDIGSNDDIVPFGYIWSDNGSPSDYERIPIIDRKVDLRLRNSIVNLGVSILTVILTRDFTLKQGIAQLIAQNLLEMAPLQKTLFFHEKIYEHKEISFINRMRELRYYSDHTFQWPVSHWIVQYGQWTSSF